MELLVLSYAVFMCMIPAFTLLILMVGKEEDKEPRGNYFYPGDLLSELMDKYSLWEKIYYPTYRFFNKIFSFFRYYLPQGIRNIIRWFPVIFWDRDYDQYYLYILIQKKLEQIYALKSNPNRSWGHVGDESLCKKIREMIILLERIERNEYWDRRDGSKNIREWHMPFKDLKISPFPGPGQYEGYMIKQDLNRLFKLLGKHVQCMWD